MAILPFFSVYTFVLEICETWVYMMQLWIQKADAYAMEQILRALCLAESWVVKWPPSNAAGSC